jgi:hypothetical protein
MSEQVADLCVLATRLHSMKIFNLSFPYVDKYFPLTGMQTFTSTAADMGFEHLTRLLDTVLDKFCDYLHVEGGPRCSDLYFLPSQEEYYSVRLRTVLKAENEFTEFSLVNSKQTAQTTSPPQRNPIS